jgi:hypothetical protein
MINPSILNGEVGRTVDRDRIRRAEASRAGRVRNETGEARTGRRPILASAAGFVSRAFAFRSRTERRAATTGC